MPQSIRLTAPEIAAIRTALGQMEDIITGRWPLPLERRVRKLTGEIETIRYLLERAEERQEVH